MEPETRPFQIVRTRATSRNLRTLRQPAVALPSTRTSSPDRAASPCCRSAAVSELPKETVETCLSLVSPHHRSQRIRPQTLQEDGYMRETCCWDLPVNRIIRHPTLVSRVAQSIQPTSLPGRRSLLVPGVSTRAESTTARSSLAVRQPRRCPLGSEVQSDGF